MTECHQKIEKNELGLFLFEKIKCDVVISIFFLGENIKYLV